MQDRIINLNPIARQKQMKSHNENNFKINEYKYETWGGYNWLFTFKYYKLYLIVHYQPKYY